MKKIGPLVLSNNRGYDSYLFLKTVPGNLSKPISDAGSVWTKFISDQPFTFAFLDDSFNKLYKSDIKLPSLFFCFQ
jgi:putative ABC transport system permease protein